MFQIKICGITTPQDAAAAVAAGADAIGLVFYEKSPRAVRPEQAETILAALAPLAPLATQAAPSRVVTVGLFVNAPVAHVLALRNALRLDLIQLHGDEPPEYLAELGGAPVMRAFRPASSSIEEAYAYLDRCAQLGCTPQRVLLDAYRPGQYGGTGQAGDWDAARRYVAERGRPGPVQPVQPGQPGPEQPGPGLVLAGGLTPENVRKAIAAVRPSAVDCSTGVESSPGVKDARRMERFVAEAKAAFAGVS